MEFQEEDVVDSKNNSFSESPGAESNDSTDNDVAMRPTHFLHSWESERKLSDVLITLSEEADDNEKPMDQFILCGGWDDAVHGWRTDNLHSSIPILKKTKKLRKEERSGSRCVVCAEMVPIIERKTGQDIEHSKTSSSTLVYNFKGENVNSSPQRTPPAFSQTKIHAYGSTISQVQASEASKEVHIQDKTDTEINPHEEKECEVIFSTSQQEPVKKHFSLLPPVKMANGSEAFASGVKPGATFRLGTQNGNQNLKIVTETLEKSNNSTTKCCLRTHRYNMAMLQVSELEKTAISPPAGITRIVNHWCWRYSLMQNNHNSPINGAPVSKLMECHNVRVQPSKIIKHHTKNIKQESSGKLAFSSGSTDKSESGIGQKATGRNILPLLPQPDPSPPSGPRIAISVLPLRLL